MLGIILRNKIKCVEDLELRMSKTKIRCQDAVQPMDKNNPGEETENKQMTPGKISYKMNRRYQKNTDISSSSEQNKAE